MTVLQGPAAAATASTASTTSSPPEVPTHSRSLNVGTDAVAASTTAAASPAPASSQAVPRVTTSLSPPAASVWGSKRSFVDVVKKATSSSP